jgi:hypothetical protein
MILFSHGSQVQKLLMRGNKRPVNS